MNEQLVSVIISGLGVALSVLIIFLFTDLKKDIRGLRSDQVEASKTAAQSKEAVEVLRAEVGFMKVIDGLRAEIASLKEQLRTAKT